MSKSETALSDDMNPTNPLSQTTLPIRVEATAIDGLDYRDRWAAFLPGRWYRFNNPDQWTCGVKVRDCRVVATGPSLQNIVGWEFGDALELARESGWTVEIASQ